MNHACPNCGYCPHCGRGGYGLNSPYIQPWPGYPQPYIGDLPGWLSSGTVTSVPWTSVINTTGGNY